MKSVSQAFVDAVHQRSRHFKFKLDFGDFVLENLESVKTEGVSCDSSGLTLGTAAIGTGSFEGRKITQDVSGKTFRAFIGLEIDGATEWCKLGKYTVSDVKTVGNTTTAEFEDDIAKLDARYDKTTLAYPALATAVLGEIASLCGVSFDTSNVPSDLTIDSLAGYTCREAVSFIAQLLGCFVAVIPATEKIGFKWYTDTGYSISTDNNLFMIDEPTCESEFTLEMISCAVDDDILTAGTGTAGLVEIENPLMTQARLDSVYESVKGLTYNAGKVPFVLGNPLLDVWDVVTVTYKDKTFKVPCMQISCTYEGGFKCDVESYVRNSDTDFEGGIKKQLGKLSTEIKAVSGEVSSKVSRDKLISEINQSPEGIKIKGSKIDLQGAVTFSTFDSDTQNKITGAQNDAANALSTANGLKSVVDADSQKIISWCSENDTAYINGGMIAARTILAGSLAANSITADEIAAGAITADKIAAKSIDAKKLNVTTLESICAKIGGFTIGSTYIANNTTALAGAANSVYLGTNGISCGTTFKVTKAGALTAKSGTIGGFTIGSKTLKSSGGGYTSVLACYDNDSSTSRILHCYDSAENDTFRILRDGTVNLINSQMIVGPVDLSNSLAVQAGHINFYYDSTRVGQLGIASVNGSFRPTFDNPLGVNGNVVMSSLGQYLYGGGKVLIGASTSGNLVIGNNEQSGDVNIYGGKGYVINLMATSSDGTTTKAAYVYRNGIYLPNTRAIIGQTTDSTECYLLYVSSANNIILGSASQTGNTHLYTASGKDIKLIVDSTTVAYVNSSGLTATSATINGTLTAQGATINGVATVNGITVNGGVTAYSLSTTYGVTCASLTTSGNVALDNNKYVTAKNTSGTAYNILGINSSGHATFGSSSLAGNAYVMCKDGYYVNLRVGSVNVAAISSSGLLMPNDMMIMCGTASSHVNAIRLKTTEIGVGYASIPLKLVGSAVTTNGSAVTSDRRLKTDINPLGDKYAKLIDKLSAVNYRYTTHRQNVVNCGFVAQDVLAALSEVGLTADEFGGFVDVYGDGREFALDYTQFVPILWEQIKSLKAKIKTLEEVNL